MVLDNSSIENLGQRESTKFVQYCIVLEPQRTTSYACQVLAYSGSMSC
jgi:hypothetical protein